LHRVGFAWPPRRRGAGALLPHHFNLACRRRHKSVADVGGVFLWHFPAGFPGSALSTTLPCDVRTFLEGENLRGCLASAGKGTGGQGGAERTIVSGPPANIKEPMYDVIYIDSDGDETPLAQHLANRSDATEVAKHEAAERGVGRMVLPGSSKLPNCVCVVPVVPEAA
jgi:hypothetical protein